MPAKLTMLKLGDADHLMFRTPHRGRFTPVGWLCLASAVCLGGVEPAQTGRVLAMVLFGVAVAWTVIHGFSTQVIFRPSLQRVKVTRTFFGRSLSHLELPYADFSLAVRRLVVSRVRLPHYVATVGRRPYLLLFPAKHYPASEKKLEDIRGLFGLEAESG